MLGSKLHCATCTSGTCTSAARLSFVLKVPLCNLRSSIINSVPCDRIAQRAYHELRKRGIVVELVKKFVKSLAVILSVDTRLVYE